MKPRKLYKAWPTAVSLSMARSIARPFQFEVVLEKQWISMNCCWCCWLLFYRFWGCFKLCMTGSHVGASSWTAKLSLLKCEQTKRANRWIAKKRRDVSPLMCRVVAYDIIFTYVFALLDRWMVLVEWILFPGKSLNSHRKSQLFFLQNNAESDLISSSSIWVTPWRFTQKNAMESEK